MGWNLPQFLFEALQGMLTDLSHVPVVQGLSAGEKLHLNNHSSSQ